MTSTTTSVSPQTKQKHQQQQHQQILMKRREGDGYRRKFRIKKCPKHLFACSIIIPFLIFLCWQPDFTEALKDVSVTIPQAVKRGSNAMLTCNYDMENDTLYSVKWYKGRREFYRYTPKENPAMKVFPSQSGLNVERNLSNQSHVVLLAVPSNISGKFTCEISVEAPSFQTAMVSGEMEVVELPEEQATVTGIQPRYRIGDLVDGNCSIKYSKPAANLTWTINGIVVLPHHIKTYQIEKYEETNLESVMSAVHFMVTTQHFIKGQMRLKCTANIFDIFKEEIESIIEEDRPRIMASGQSYPPDHIYGTHGESDGYEQNESYLTYFSAPKSSASTTADFFAGNIVHVFKQNMLKSLQMLMSHRELAGLYCLTETPVNYLRSLPKVKATSIPTALAILLAVVLLQIYQQKLLTTNSGNKLTQKEQLTSNGFNKFQRVMRKKTENFLTINLSYKRQCKNEKGRQKTNENYYQDATDVCCQAKCEQQYQDEKHFSVANQTVVKVKASPNDTDVKRKCKNSKINSIAATIAAIDCQQNLPQAIVFVALPPPSYALVRQPLSPSVRISLLRSSPSTALSCSKSSLSLPGTLGQRKTHAHDSFPFCAADAPKSNNANFMSKNQTLLMTLSATAAASNFVVAAAIASTTTTTPTPTTISPVKTLVLASELLQTSVSFSLAAIERNSSPLPIFSRNNYLMAFIEELLLRQC